MAAPLKTELSNKAEVCIQVDQSRNDKIIYSALHNQREGKYSAIFLKKGVECL